jgi:hypothetical protein
VEREIKLPLPEGFGEQYVIGLCQSENGLEVFTNTYSNDNDTTTVHYFRHTVHTDGSITTADEQWLNELAPNGGNEMRVQRAEDGALYMTLTGFDENYQMMPMVLASRDDGKTGESLTGDGVSLLEQAYGFWRSRQRRHCDLRVLQRELLFAGFQRKPEGETGGRNTGAGPAITAHGTQIALVAKGAQSILVTDTTDGTTTEYPYTFAEQTYPRMTYASDGTLYLCDPTGYTACAGRHALERIVDGSSTTIGLPRTMRLRCMPAQVKTGRLRQRTRGRRFAVYVRCIGGSGFHPRRSPCFRWRKTKRCSRRSLCLTACAATWRWSIPLQWSRIPARRRRTTSRR